MASIGMLLALNGWKPYIYEDDDLDAVIAQMVTLFITVFIFVRVTCFNSKQTITLTLCVGLLSLSDDDPQDWAFGLSMNLPNC
jgi:hypothetical protein